MSHSWGQIGGVILAFPRSRFVGYDLSETAIPFARAEASDVPMQRVDRCEGKRSAEVKRISPGCVKRLLRARGAPGRSTETHSVCGEGPAETYIEGAQGVESVDDMAVGRECGRSFPIRRPGWGRIGLSDS